MTDLYDESNDDRPRRLERGWVKHKLMRELATNQKDTRTLGEEYGVSATAISKFRRRHQAEIDEIASDLENQFAALWIAGKAARIAEYQADVDMLSDVIQEVPTPDLVKIKHAAMRAVAEELGQLPSRNNIQVNNAPVTYTVSGADMSRLT